MVSFFPLFLMIVTFIVFTISDNCYFECKDTTIFANFQIFCDDFLKQTDIRHKFSGIYFVFNELQTILNLKYQHKTDIKPSYYQHKIALKRRNLFPTWEFLVPSVGIFCSQSGKNSQDKHPIYVSLMLVYASIVSVIYQLIFILNI